VTELQQSLVSRKYYARRFCDETKFLLRTFPLPNPPLKGEGNQTEFEEVCWAGQSLLPLTLPSWGLVTSVFLFPQSQVPNPSLR